MYMYLKLRILSNYYRYGWEMLQQSKPQYIHVFIWAFLSKQTNINLIPKNLWETCLRECLFDPLSIPGIFHSDWKPKGLSNNNLYLKSTSESSESLCYWSTKSYKVELHVPEND